MLYYKCFAVKVLIRGIKPTDLRFEEVTLAVLPRVDSVYVGVPVRRLCMNQLRNDIGLATRIIWRAVKHRLLVCAPRASDSVGPVVMQVGSEICISNTFPVRPHSENQWLLLWSRGGNEVGTKHTDLQYNLEIRLGRHAHVPILKNIRTRSIPMKLE